MIGSRRRRKLCLRTDNSTWGFHLHDSDHRCVPRISYQILRKSQHYQFSRTRTLSFLYTKGGKILQPVATPGDERKISQDQNQLKSVLLLPN